LGRVYLNLDVYDFAGFGLNFDVQNTQLVFFGFRLQAGVQKDQIKFFIREFHKGAQQVGEHAFVALVPEQQLENPVVGWGEYIVHSLEYSEDRRIRQAAALQARKGGGILAANPRSPSPISGKCPGGRGRRGGRFSGKFFAFDEQQPAKGRG
jgi:hypothetical protein